MATTPTSSSLSVGSAEAQAADEALKLVAQVQGEMNTPAMQAAATARRRQALKDEINSLIALGDHDEAALQRIRDLLAAH